MTTMSTDSDCSVSDYTRVGTIHHHETMSTTIIQIEESPKVQRPNFSRGEMLDPILLEKPIRHR